MTLSELARVAMTSRGSHGHARPSDTDDRVIVPVTVLVGLCRPGEATPFAHVPVAGYALTPYAAPYRPEGGELVPESLPRFVLTCTLPVEVVEPDILSSPEMIPDPPAPVFDGATGLGSTTIRIVEGPLPGTKQSDKCVVLTGGEWTAPPVPTSTELES